MGAEAKRRRQFLAEHPMCCFCGGDTPATTEDHVPPRIMFRERQWPEGYVFPACQPCNSATRFAEQVMGMIARISVEDSDEVYEREAKAIMDGVRNNNPDLFHELRARPNEVRRFLRERGIALPAGKTTADVPIIHLNGPIATASLRAFARKLFLALHFKETGRIVPQSGGLRYWWWSNLQAAEGKIPNEVTQMMTGYRHLKRANRELSDQFKYRYEASEDGTLGMYMAQFNASFAINGIVVLDASVLIENMDDRKELIKPFPSPLAA